MMTFPNDFQSFLQMNTTPTLANVNPSRILDYSSEGLELVEVLDEVTPLAPPPRRGSLVKPLALVPLPVETTTAVSVDVTANTAATFHSVESASTAGSDKMVISRSNSDNSTQDNDDQYSPVGRQEEDDDDDSGSLGAKATPTMPTMVAPDPIHAFSLSPPSSVVSLGLVSS